MKENLVARVLKKVAPKIGAKVFLEKKWGKVGSITFINGRKCYFRVASFDLNRIGSSNVARDKDYAKLFMRRMGYSVIPGKAFCSEEWGRAIGSRETGKAAYSYALRLGWPVIVKPNSQSQGRGVCKVYSKSELERAYKQISNIDRMILVEDFIEGRDYRLVVLDDRVISAYERIPLSVVGDGKCSIRELLVRKQRQFIRNGRDTVINFKDRRITGKLRRQGLSMSSCLGLGKKVFLLDNANLSSGGDSIDVTDSVSPGFQNMAVRLTKDMGLRLCGVDLMVNGDITRDPRNSKHWIIEINAAPGLDHYATIGAKQEKIVEKLYLSVLKAMQAER